ncbi:hypothetical protein R6242_10820 [Iodobacter sp. CM08]|uniref:hypothetical protein n=1 Tax=Iodobacter sp. CM08 TaxID=3085902 RepID=UPI002982AC79|nr:hypothetical protein [Iodobacter sp. CM08]MDW5417057.1 hypothetical protein [Iodobacter sp. CM08]
MNPCDISPAAFARAQLVTKVSSFQNVTPINKAQKPFKPVQKAGLSTADALSDSQEQSLVRIKEYLLKLHNVIIERHEFAVSQNLPVDFEGFDRMRMEMGMMIKGVEDAFAKSWHARAAGFVKSRAA